ncbi:MAG: LamG-like jellyroll fold domain-containing protein [Roseibacillus sp.]
MRYAIFSDVHANRQAWEAVREDIVKQEADTLVCLGDVVGYGPRPLEVLAALRAVTANFVLGNHDAAACGRLDPSIFNERARTVIEWTRQQLDEDALQFLMQVPLQMDGQELRFVHAEIVEPGEFGYVEGIAAAEVNLKAMTGSLGFIGHTHLPLAYTMPVRGGPVKQLPPHDFPVERGQRYIINVGSVGEPRTTDVRASYVIYDDVARKVSYRRVAFDVEAYKADLAESGLDILPYFVQVVDAGKVAGAPQPAAAPQLALAQLPKVAEGVAGGHGRLVVGMPTPGSRPPGVAPMTVSRSRSNAPWGIGIAALVTILLAVIAIAVMQRGSDKTVTAGEGGAVENEKVRRSPGPPGAVNQAETGGPIRDLVVRRFGKNFQSLAELRAAGGEEHTEEKVGDGMLSLVHGGKEACGLVWEGYLRVPEKGLYQFTLRASSGAALVIYEEEQVLSESGSLASAHILLRRGHAPVRVEYFQREGESGPALTLHWSGPGLDGNLSLVRRGASKGGAIARNDPGPDPVEPEPAPEPVALREAPEKISQELFAYWSFNRREPKADSRFTRTSRGVEEKLIMKGQPLRYLRPAADPRSRGWIRPGFDDSADWLDGKNGVGYEDEPGDFKDLLHTRIETAKGKHPHSLYLRIPFEVKDPDDYQGLALFMQYDDGFEVSLNGSVAGSRNAPFPLEWNSGASKQKGDRDAVKPEAVKLGTRRIQSLVPGTNVLAIHALNSGGRSKPNATNTGCTSSDMLILAELVGLRKDRELPEENGPGKPNRHDRVIEEAMIKGQVSEAPGKFGEAFDFQGGSLDIGSKNEFAIADQSCTISLWFTRNPGSTDGQARRLISAGAGSDQKAGWAIWIQKDGSGLTFRVGDGNAASDLTAKKDSLVNGEWHHVAVTVERESRQVHLFLDGELAGESLKVDLLAGGTIGSHSGLCIGRNSDDQQHHLGKIDEVALWHRALLPEEIEKIFRSGQSGEAAGDLFDAEPAE